MSVEVFVKKLEKLEEHAKFLGLTMIVDEDIVVESRSELTKPIPRYFRVAVKATISQSFGEKK